MCTKIYCNELYQIIELFGKKFYAGMARLKFVENPYLKNK